MNGIGLVDLGYKNYIESVKEIDNNNTRLSVGDALVNEEINDEFAKKNFTIEFDGEHIKCEKYYFEYPKKNDESAGVLGYERVTIGKDALFSFIDTRLKSSNINLKELGISTYEEILERMDHSIDCSNSSKNYKGIDREVKLEVQEQLQKYCFKLLSYFSDGKYPYHTFNHQLAAYTWEKRFMHRKNFQKGQFFKQKIFEHQLVKENKYLFQNHNSKLNLQYKEGGLPHVDKILDGKYATTGDQGFNMVPGNFFGSPIKDGICFGFDLEEKSMKGYIDNAFEYYISVGNMQSDQIYDLVYCSIWANRQFQEKLKFLYGLGEPLNIEDTEVLFFDIVKYVIDAIASKYPDLNTEISKERGPLTPSDMASSIAFDLSSLTHWFHEYKPSDSGSEKRIPIFINYPDIKQLSWGDAKYGHIFNNKGFNFFKFKHQS